MANKLRYPIEILNPDINTNSIPSPKSDDEPTRKQWFFAAGKWTPGLAPLTAGDGNFADVRDVRQVGNALEGVQGYVNQYTSAPVSYFKCRAGVQLRTLFSTKSRVIGQFWDSSVVSAVLLQNFASINASGSFVTSPLFSDTPGAGVGRFAIWPGNHAVYCNGTDMKIYAGDEMRCAALLTASAIPWATVSPRDYTDQVNNDLTTTDEVVPIGAAQVGKVMLVGALRPLQAIVPYVVSGYGNSTSTASLTMETWTGDAWSVVTITDLSSGFASTARVTWSNAVGLSRLRYQDGYVFNWYKFSLSSGESKIYRITCDAAIQDVVDVWNGEYLPVGCAAAYGGIDYQDWTDYMNDDSRDTYMTVVTAPPYACLYFGFPVDVQGVKLWLLPSTYNSDKASLIVERYTGTVSASAWTAVSGLLDNTATGSYTLNKTGVVFWTAASKSEVFKTNMFEEQHYLYRFRWNDSIGFATSVRIWKAAGIPAPQKLLPYRFPFLFKGRPMLCGLNIANEGNRVDFGQVDSNAFFNGSDSSLGTDVDPLYFGETESLTAACEVFNRIGSNLYHVAVFTKDRETYILNGYDPETFQIMKLSSDTGCPAPKTMDTVEIGFGEQGNVRCAAIWLSYNGPVLCDVTNLYPMDADIECYFDALDSRCINWSAVSAAVGWVDQEQMEYNLCIPSGSGQTTNNVWLFLDVQTQKWWKRGAPQTPQAVIKVADTNGKIYIYGMCDDGIMRSLDQGEQYGSTVMSRYVETGEILPTGNMWDVTRLRRLKVLTGVVSETALLSITHAGSGASMGGGTAIASVSVNTQGAYVKDTESLNLLAWSHRLKFALSGGVTGRGLQLIAWGAEFMKEREDH